MIEEARLAIGVWYPYIKALHVMSVALWAFSTAVAWAFYLKPVLQAARANPEDVQLRRRRDEFMKRFDAGASFEHVAFVLLVVTALLMLWVNQIDLGVFNFLTFKLLVGIVIIVPMEAIDVWLSHLGGSKAHLAKQGDDERYEQVMEWHWKFFRVTEPLVIVLVPAMFVIAVAKPF